VDDVSSISAKKDPKKSVENSPDISSSRIPAQVEDDDLRKAAKWIAKHTSMFFAGVTDSLSFHRTIPILLNDNISARLTAQILTTNGVLLLGSIFLYNRAIEPLLVYMKQKFDPDVMNEQTLNDEDTSSDQALWILYQFLWLLPICLLCYGCSMAWYQDLADNTYKYLRGVPKSASLTKSVGNALYGTLVWASAFLQVKLLTGLAPYVLSQIKHGTELFFLGASMASNESAATEAARLAAMGGKLSAEAAGAELSKKFSSGMTQGFQHAVLLWIEGANKCACIAGLCLLCLMYGWYGYDPKWIASGLDPDQRFGILERHWAYFVGFGCPYVLLGETTTFFVGYGTFLALFPFCILLGSICDYTAPYNKYEGNDSDDGTSADSTNNAATTTGNTSGAYPDIVPFFKPAQSWTLFIIKYVDKTAYQFHQGKTELLKKSKKERNTHSNSMNHEEKIRTASSTSTNNQTTGNKEKIVKRK